MSADHWEFYLDARGLWCWRRLRTGRNVISDSKRCFPTRDQCIADAEKHGFADRSARRRRLKAVKTAGMRGSRRDAGRIGVPGPR